MKFKVLMLYDAAYAIVGNATSSINRAYAHRWGYDFVCCPNRLDVRLRPAWSKFRLIEQEMATCDWLLWLDADALIVNHDPPLENLVREDKDLLLSTDSCGYCTGVFLIRNCAWSLQLMQAALFLGPLVLGDFTKVIVGRDYSSEQDTLVALIKAFPWVSARCAGIPEDIVQCPESTFNAKALAMHFWGNNLGPDYTPICRAIGTFLKQGYTPDVQHPSHQQA